MKIVLLLLAVASVSGCVPIANVPGMPNVPVGTQTFVYEVTSDVGTAASINYSTISADGSGQEQAVDAALPWSYSDELPVSLTDNIFVLGAQASTDATTITCTITVDGTVLSTKTSTGASAVVMCGGNQ